jgi:hypothetical protein
LPGSWLSRVIVGITTLVMFGAAAAMFIRQNNFRIAKAKPR